MAIQLISLVPAFFGGILIGLFYFGGLWWTIRRLSASQHPWLWTLGSFLIRTCLSLAGFYMIMGGHWERLLVSLPGFILLRVFLIKRLGPVTTQHSI